jgi:hypothetical protein
MTTAMHDRYSCARCGAEFTSPDELREHTSQVHEVAHPSERAVVVAGGPL